MRITGKITIPAQVSTRPALWRVKHDIEIDRDVWRPKLPEVHPILVNHYTRFTKYWQLLSKSMNSRITAAEWREIYHWRLWITNYQGFDKPDDDRADYVTPRDLDKEDPKVECLTCGGSLITGYIQGDEFVVSVLNANDPAPTLDWMKDHPWYWTWAVSCDSGGTPRRFPQHTRPNGEVIPSVHPMMGDPRRYARLTLPGWQTKLERWTGSDLPDPYKLYSPLR